MRSIIKCLILFCFSLNIYTQEQSTNKEVDRFAKNIEISINNNSPFLLNNSIDYAEVLESFIDKNITMNAFNKFFIEQVKFNYGLGTMMCEEVSGLGRIEFLSSTKTSVGYTLLFRTFAKKGINYYELNVRTSGKTIYLTDAFIYKPSTKYSTHLKSIYTSLLHENISHSSENSNELEFIQSFTKIKLHLANRKYQKAFKVWENLPDDMKYRHDYLIKGIEASSYFSTSITQQLIGKYSAVYENDRRFYLLPLEGYYQRAEFDYALNSLDSLSLAVNHDPYLNLYRGLIYKEMKNIPKAEVHYRQFIEALPFESTGYFSLLELYLTNNKHYSATEMLTQMTMRFGYYKQDFSGILKKYPSFLNSEAYSNWLKE